MVDRLFIHRRPTYPLRGRFRSASSFAFDSRFAYRSPDGEAFRDNRAARCPAAPGPGADAKRIGRVPGFAAPERPTTGIRLVLPVAGQNHTGPAGKASPWSLNGGAQGGRRAHGLPFYDSSRPTRPLDPRGLS